MEQLIEEYGIGIVLMLVGASVLSGLKYIMLHI